MRKIKGNVSDPTSIDKAVKGLRDYQRWVDSLSAEMAKYLADLGATKARANFGTVIYDGRNDVEVTVEPAERGFKVLAKGETVLFLEFGAGIKFGYGHPMAQQLGFGPGTYNPSSGNWQNPNGWVFKDDSGKYIHTYGNKPAQGMYDAMTEVLSADIKEIFEKCK